MVGTERSAYCLPGQRLLGRLSLCLRISLQDLQGELTSRDTLYRYVRYIFRGNIRRKCYSVDIATSILTTISQPSISSILWSVTNLMSPIQLVLTVTVHPIYVFDKYSEFKYHGRGRKRKR